MKTALRFGITLSALIIAPPLHAGTVIETSDGDGASSTIRISGDKARIDSADDGGYMLMDMSADKVYSVNKEEHMVIDVSTAMTGLPESGDQEPPQHELRIIKKGAGPAIAGHDTVHYRIMAGEQHCFDEYLAPGLLENKEIKRFARMMSQWAAGQQGTMNMMLGDDAPCASLEGAMEPQYAKLGVPMRTIEGDGTVSHEIARVDTDVSIPSAVFEFPEGYPVHSQEELMQRGMQGMPGGDSQGMDPQQFEEMKKHMQEMLEQMQQQRQD